MVLEYAGSELFNYIVDHGKMQEDKARQFLQQIVCAVEYCHRHKIVHRDLKPENLLLDDNLHVKIADFGLSNIMTDGNFLKTSCGSPNYAAPEVISGKLYAGPEVDVWSCGVILYVLLVGRLPFDDEYIPALFKKIANGSYHIPSSLSSGAVRLIKKMLQTSPVHRITVQEIRQDPWFTKDLPAYLQPPVEEFLDTGVDPSKAIDPSSLAPNKPPQVQEEIHNSVVGKLGKTMGYGRDDVHQALAVDEPNAIKDAYLIVRENQIMKETPAMTQDPALQPFLAQSPPPHTTPSPITSFGERTNQPESLHKFASPGQPNDRPRQGSGQAPQVDQSRSPVNTIGVLPSSLPDYHEAFMKGQPRPTQSQQPHDALSSSPHAPSTTQQKQSPEAQAATARRLKPHSRSQGNLERLNKPQGMTPVQGSSTGKKTKQTKWQFGIRSRNQPAEAMLAIYKALKAMGAEWEVPRIRRPHGQERREHHDSSDGSVSGSDDDSGSDGPAFGSDGEDGHYSHKHTSSHSDSGASGASSSSRGRPSNRSQLKYNASNDWGYPVPSDPWIINARFRKDGMYAPGVRHPNSSHSSRADLLAEGRSQHTVSSASSELAEHQLRRASEQSSPPTPSTAGPASATSATAPSLENPSMTGPAAGPPQATAFHPGSSSGSRPQSRKTSLTHLLGSAAGSMTSAGTMAGVEADDSAYVYVTIQLYTIEKEFYLVDFKCAGYEHLVPKEMMGSPETSMEASGNGERDLVGAGRAADEKDVSSPFPFLDVASRLIIQLAEAE